MILAVSGAVVLLTSLVVAAWMAVFGHGVVRVYWIDCGLALLAGGIGLVGVLLVPLERFDEEGRLIGEMPPAFGVALLSLVVGLAGVSLGLAATAGRWLWRLWRRRPPLG